MTQLFKYYCKDLLMLSVLFFNMFLIQVFKFEIICLNLLSKYFISVSTMFGDIAVWNQDSRHKKQGFI